MSPAVGGGVAVGVAAGVAVGVALAAGGVAAGGLACVSPGVGGMCGWQAGLAYVILWVRVRGTAGVESTSPRRMRKIEKMG